MRNINHIYDPYTVKQKEYKGQGDKMVHFAINFIAQVIFIKQKNIVKYLQKVMFHIFRKNHFNIAGNKINQLQTKEIYSIYKILIRNDVLVTLLPFVQQL